MSVVAGAGSAGVSTDVPATAALLREPTGVAVDARGNVFIADRSNNRIVVVDHSSGYLSTVAGNGSSGAVTPGPATSSALRIPLGVAVTGTGTAYIADQNNHQVQKLSLPPTTTPARMTSGAAPATATVGTPYTHTFTGTGDPAPTFRVTSGALPAGLTLDPVTGTLSGTPTIAQSAAATVVAGNFVGDEGQTVSIVVSSAPAAPVFTSAAPPAATVGAAYAHTFTAAGYPAPTFRVSNGALPPGLTLNGSTGVLDGTATSAGTTAFTVSAGNGVGADADQAVNATVVFAPQAPAFTSAVPPAATVGIAYAQTVTATGYPAPTLQVISGGLPVGLSLDPVSGLISGSPTTAGPATFTVRAENASGTADQAVALEVAPAPVAPAFTAVSPPAGTVDQPYAYTIAATGVPTVSYTITAGALPPGLGLDRVTGALTGTPTVAGAYRVVVAAANGVAPPATAAVTIVVAPAPRTPGTVPGNPTDVQVTGLGTTARVTFLPPTDAGSGPVTGYRVSVTGASLAAPVVATGSTSPVLVAGLTAGQTYLVTVTAVNAAGRGLPSAPVQTTWAAPPAPSQVVRVSDLAPQTGLPSVTAIFFPAGTRVPAAVLATSGSHADSLAGARLASAVGGPLLLTGGTALDATVVAELRRLLAPGGRVYVLGDVHALSPTVRDALTREAGYDVVRLGGADRYETAARISAAVLSADPNPAAPVYLASAADFPDGLAAAALAGSTGGVVLLTAGKQLPAATEAYLTAHDPTGARTTTVGGAAAAAYPRAGTSIVGVDRYATASLVARRFTRPASLGIASGEDWRTAATGAAAMSGRGEPLLFTGPAVLAPATGAALRTGSRVSRVWVFGSSTVISPRTVDTIGALLTTRLT
nr:putative Ig domain-containing protein [Kineococcus siccus]